MKRKLQKSVVFCLGIFKFQAFVLVSVTFLLFFLEIFLFSFLGIILTENSTSPQNPLINSLLVLEAQDLILIIFSLAITIFLLKSLLNFLIPHLSAEVGGFLMRLSAENILIKESRNLEKRKTYFGALELITCFTTLIRSILLIISNLIIFLGYIFVAFFFISLDHLAIFFVFGSLFVLVTIFIKKLIQKESFKWAEGIGPRASTFSKIIESNNEIIIGSFKKHFTKLLLDEDMKIRYSQRNNTFLSTIPKSLLDLIFVILVIYFLSMNVDSETSISLPGYIILALLGIQRALPYLQVILINYGRVISNLFQSQKLITDFPSLFEENIKSSSKPIIKNITHLEIRDLSIETNSDAKIVFPSFNLIQGINFLQGPSGSGKTSFYEILSGINQNYSGSIHSSNNESIDEINSSVFFMRQDNNLVFDSVKEFCRYSNITMSDLQSLSLISIYDNSVSSLSSGQLQRLKLLQALNSDCAILLLDEASSNLNSNYFERISSLINQKALNKIVCLSTHDKHFYNAFSDSSKKINLINLNGG